LKTLSIKQVRQFAVIKQRLGGERPAPTLNGLKELMRDIRCLQIDPIRAVERTQFLVLFSRLGIYDPDLIRELAYQEKFLFEYWAHAMSYVLTEDFPIYKPQMTHHFSGTSNWATKARNWLESNQDFQQYVIDELQARGPLLTKEIEDRAVKPWKSGGWTSDNNGPMMVDFLWSSGRLMVADRDGLKKYWDLAENVLPDWTPQEELADYDRTYHAAQLSLKALGVANAKQIKNHFIRNAYPELSAALKQLEADGLIEQVAIKGKGNSPWQTKGPWYIHSDDMTLLENLANEWQPRTVLLSPFDNLICDRERTEMLWDYYFRIEIYVPKVKREFGYYVLPILHGEKLIGRIDPKMDRKAGILHIHNIYAEADAPQSKKAATAVRKAIEELGAFLGANDIQYNHVHPDGWQGVF
jgi:uncharacterized protein YcaQ